MMSAKIQRIWDESCRIHAERICDWVLRGNGRRKVPKVIYLAVWELQYALNRTEAEQETCQWREDDDAYWTECGHGFNCMTDGIEDNGFRFCPYCGGRIVLVAKAAERGE